MLHLPCEQYIGRPIIQKAKLEKKTKKEYEGKLVAKHKFDKTKEESQRLLMTKT